MLTRLDKERLRIEAAAERQYAQNAENMRRIASFGAGCRARMSGSPMGIDHWLMTCVGMPNGPRLNSHVSLTWSQLEDLVRTAYDNGKSTCQL